MYKNYKLSDCSNFLGNSNPLIKNGKIIFRNLNRLFFFISLNNNNKNNEDLFEINIQISLSHFLIGLIIQSILLEKTKYEKDAKIASDEKTNKIIHKLLQKPPKKLRQDYNYYLILTFSNNNAIFNPFSYSIKIKPLTFVILLILNRFENNPSLFFFNNDYVTEDTINYLLASIHITY